MSKTQTLGWAVVSGIVTSCCWAITGLGLIGTAAMVVCIGFMLLYGYKRWSHARLLKAARAELQHEPTASVIEMTNRGSSHLFVPRPLDR
jgi:predicted DNA repair protein MutK